MEENQLSLYLGKYLFLVSKFTFLGFFINGEGIQVDPTRIKSVVEKPTLNIHEIMSFQGFVTFYCKFIQNFSLVATLIIKCLKRERFSWGYAQEDSFIKLKKKLCVTLVLAHPKFLIKHLKLK